MNKFFQLLNKNKGLLGILPALIFVLFFFIGGFFQALSISFGGQDEYYGNQGFLWAYKELLNEDFFLSLARTTGIAVLISLLSGFIGFFSAFILALKSYRWKWLHIILQLPVGVPHLLAGYMLMQVFMQTGWYSRIAYGFGFIESFEQFPSLVHDKWGIGMMLAYMWKEIPFIVLLIYPFIVKLLATYQETAKMLGANFFQMVRWVIVPIVFPIWVGGMWVVFSFALGAYEIPALLGGSSMKLVPVMAWQEYTHFGLERQPLAIAMNVVLAGVSFIIGMILLNLQLRWYKKGRRVWDD